ncbi:helix-turn-helix domain-containing protein [Glaciimonas sp. GG7]
MRNRTLEAPNGIKSRLTSLEFSFVKIFASFDVGEAVSRKKIVYEFGEDYLNYDQNRLDTMVMRLRKKIVCKAKMEIPLHTVRIRGFAFCDILILGIFD